MRFPSHCASSWAAIGLALLLMAAAAPAAGATPKKAQAAPPAYGQRDDVMRFADEVATRNPELGPTWVREQLAQARHVTAVAQAIQPPPAGTAKNWAAYRARFVERERIALSLIHI